MKQLKKSGQNVLQGKRTDEKNLKIANDRIVIEGTKTETYSGHYPIHLYCRGTNRLNLIFR